jgi:hypothetical protein
MSTGKDYSKFTFVVNVTFNKEESFFRVADPDPDPMLDPWIRIQGPGWAKNPELGSGIRDEHPGSYF